MTFLVPIFVFVLVVVVVLGYAMLNSASEDETAALDDLAARACPARPALRWCRPSSFGYRIDDDRFYAMRGHRRRDTRSRSRSRRSLSAGRLVERVDQAPGRAGEVVALGQLEQPVAVDRRAAAALDRVRAA